MQQPSAGSVLKSVPLVLLSLTHLWLVQECMSKGNSLQAPALCSNPPLTTLGLLALSYIEFTRGVRIRGAIALLVVAIPNVMRIVSDVIN